MKKLTGKIYWIFMLCTLPIAFLSCKNTAKLAEPTSIEFDKALAREEIEKANMKFMAFVSSGDSVGIASMYTEDAKLMFAGRPPDVGRAQIQTTFSGILNSGVDKIDLKTHDVYGTENLLIEEGEAFIYVGANLVAEEKYMIVWKKEDSEWKLFRDIANSNGTIKPQ